MGRRRCGDDYHLPARINGQNRTRGFTRALEEGGSKVAQYLESKDYTRAEAQQQALDLLTANPDARGFFTQHDEATLGAWTAIEDAGKQDDLILVGFDGSPESVELIRQGKLKAASMQQPVLMGRMSLDVTLKHLRGEDVEKETEVPTILVTPENLADVESTLADTVLRSKASSTRCLTSSPQNRALERRPVDGVPVLDSEQK